ncbi:MAG: hypothetical protein WC803_06240 [Sphingomonas sp.]|jgi:hypothetical protein
MRPMLIAAMLLSLSVAGIAAAQESSEPPKRIRSILLGDNEKCPQSTADEIIVCGRQDEPYRIPKQLRKTPEPRQSQSWTARVAALDEVSRKSSGLPDSCSAVGTGGQTGCTALLLRQWRAERAAAKKDAETLP